MKEFGSPEFRDELAKTVKQTPKAERRGILTQARETREIADKYIHTVPEAERDQIPDKTAVQALLYWLRGTVGGDTFSTRDTLAHVGQSLDNLEGQAVADKLQAIATDPTQEERSRKKVLPWSELTLPESVKQAVITIATQEGSLSLRQVVGEMISRNVRDFNGFYTIFTEGIEERYREQAKAELIQMQEEMDKRATKWKKTPTPTSSTIPQEDEIIKRANAIRFDEADKVRKFAIQHFLEMVYPELANSEELKQLKKEWKDFRSEKVEGLQQSLEETFGHKPQIETAQPRRPTEGLSNEEITKTSLDLIKETYEAMPELMDEKSKLYLSTMALEGVVCRYSEEDEDVALFNSKGTCIAKMDENTFLNLKEGGFIDKRESKGQSAEPPYEEYVITENGRQMERFQYRKDREDEYRENDNLTEDEIQELLDLELTKELSKSTKDHIRYLYLRFKVENPVEAEQMLEELGNLANLDESQITEGDILQLLGIFLGYGFYPVFYFQGRPYVQEGGIRGGGFTIPDKEKKKLE